MKKIILLLVVILAANVYPQGEWKQYSPEYNHIPYPPDINVIRVDRFNNIWFGTTGYDNEYGIVGGLAKFDGENWTQYTKTNSTLPDGYITAIAFDKEDNTWIGMKDSGLAILKNDTISLVKGHLQFIEKGEVKNILTDKNGNIWVLFFYVRYPGRVYKSSALMRYDGETWVNFNLDSITTSSWGVTAITLDKENNLYCGGYDGILKYDGSNWSNIDTTFKNKVSFLAFDSLGILWVGLAGFSPSTKLLLYDNGSWKNTTTVYSGWEPSAILFDKNGNTWVGSIYGEALSKYSGENWQYLNRENSALLWNNINDIAIDSTGVLWCGTPFGACTFDGENWKYYASSGGLPYEQVNKVIIDDADRKLVATNHLGLVKYDGNTWQVYDKTNSGIPFNDVNDIAIDGEKKIWVATTNGLGVFDGESWEVYNEDNTGYPINNVWDIEVDSKNKVWLTIFNGNMLLSFDGTNWQFFDSTNSILPDDFNGHLGIDPADKVWLGTGYGFFVYDGTNWIHYNTENSALPYNGVQCFAFDSTGNSWVGTLNGIVRIKDGEWEVFNHNNTNIVGWDINDIAVDSQNNILVGFYWRQGIARYDGVSWKHYNKEFEPGFGGINAMSLDFDKKGNLWIGTTYSGLIQFNEDKIVSVETINDPLKKEEQNVSIYPNPFNSQANIVFTLNETSNVKVKVYSITGELVFSRAQRLYSPGKNSLQFNASYGGGLASGIYFCLLEVNPLSQTQKQFYTKKLLLLK